MTDDRERSQQSHCTVLVPAAGQGSRLGGKRKQYRTLGGAPLLVQTLRVFEQHPAVNSLVLAVPSAEKGPTEQTVVDAGITKLASVVPGGDTRRTSVAAALRAAPGDADVVLVHDAVRPFVSQDLISRVIEAVRSHGAAAPALPVSDTLRRGGADGYFEETFSREGLFRMQTPQGFRHAWIREAHAAAERDEVPATDDVALVQRIGHPVYRVEGHARNFKITTPDDWEMAQALWPHWTAAT